MIMKTDDLHWLIVACWPWVYEAPLWFGLPLAMPPWQKLEIKKPSLSLRINLHGQEHLMFSLNKYCYKHLTVIWKCQDNDQNLMWSNYQKTYCTINNKESHIYTCMYI